MEFIDSLLSLSEQIGWEPIDIFFFCIVFSIFLWEFISLLLFWGVRRVVCLVRWLRSRRKKSAD